MLEIEAPEEYICPLTLDVMEDPVMSKYGQSFERSEILEWLKAGHGVCPLSRRPLSLQDLVTNHGLRMRISEWRKENGDDDVVVVAPPATNQIYGFITLPSKDDGTDRTIDEEEDLFYLQLAALGLGGPPPQPIQLVANPDAQPAAALQRHRQRRDSAGAQARTTRRHGRAIRRPLRGLRNFFAGTGPSLAQPSTSP